MTDDVVHERGICEAILPVRRRMRRKNETTTKKKNGWNLIREMKEDDARKSTRNFSSSKKGLKNALKKTEEPFKH